MDDLQALFSLWILENDMIFQPLDQNHYKNKNPSVLQVISAGIDNCSYRVKLHMAEWMSNVLQA